MIINVLVDRRALFDVEHFYKRQDCEVLFGEGVRPADLNDDALGRALDKLSEVELTKLFSSVVLSFLAAQGQSIGRLHFDTTSISVEGAYDGEGDLKITYGYSKDRRPDLKQFMLGMAVTPQGLPVMGQPLDGNQSDKLWYLEAMGELKKVMNDEQFKSVTFVADAALVTKKNLAQLTDKTKFISRLPETFEVADEVKELAWKTGQWHPVGTLSPKKDAASYRCQSFLRSIEGQEYRLVVVHSTALDARKEKSLAAKWRKQREEIEEAAAQLAKRVFACEPDAQAAAAAFLKEHKNKPFHLEAVVRSTSVTKHAGRGRPAKDAIPQTTVTFTVEVKVNGEDQQAMAEEKARASTFVLITNLHDSNQYPDHQILREYKEQGSVERQFRFLKSPYMVAPIFLKKKNRVEALTYVFLFALLIAALLEIRVREALSKSKRVLDTGSRKVSAPTATLLLDRLNDIQVVLINGKYRTVDYDEAQVALEIIHLAGFTDQVYLNVPQLKR